MLLTHVRCPTPSQAAEWDPGRLGSRAAHQLRGTPGSIPKHASPRLAPPLGSLPRGRVQAVATRSPEMPIFSARLNSLRSRTPRPSALGHRRSPSKSPRAARLPKWRRQGSSLTFSALSAALPTPLAEGMRKKGTGARSSGSGVGARIRSLPPPSAALPAAANVGFLVRLSLRYRTPAPGTSRPPG